MGHAGLAPLVDLKLEVSPKTPYYKGQTTATDPAACEAEKADHGPCTENELRGAAVCVTDIDTEPLRAWGHGVQHQPGTAH